MERESSVAKNNSCLEGLHRTPPVAGAGMVEESPVAKASLDLFGLCATERTGCPRETCTLLSGSVKGLPERRPARQLCIGHGSLEEMGRGAKQGAPRRVPLGMGSGSRGSRQTVGKRFRTACSIGSDGKRSAFNVFGNKRPSWQGDKPPGSVSVRTARRITDDRGSRARHAGFVALTALPLVYRFINTAPTAHSASAEMTLTLSLTSL